MAVPMFMIISGYVYAISFEKNDIVALRQAYSLTFIIPKFIRYTIPFVMAFCVETIGELLLSARGIRNFSIKHWINIFFEGGRGPGSYYYPILLQFLLFYPVIYFIIRKFAFKGLLFCLLLNALFEFFQRMWHCNGEFYRLLLFRYTLVIAFGSWLWQWRQEKIHSLWKVISFFTGVVFILLYCYIKLSPKIIIYWTSTCFVACLYLLPIASFLIRKVHISCRPAELLGKASFNIFLVQMVYFTYAVGFVRKLVQAHFVQLCAHIGICVVAGLLFFFVEQKLTGFVLARYKKRPLAN